MISVQEAKQIISENVKSLSPVTTVLEKAMGKILAADVFASIDIPAYPQSSMDGYAFRFNDLQQSKSLLISGEMAAGANEQFELLPGRAARIFTGAPLPDGADTVVMQEKTRVANATLIIEDERLQAGTNVRQKGSETKTGETALAKNSLLTPAAIGFLAGLGVTDIIAYPFPSVSIILTGNELQHPGQPLQYGQVYESNSFTLKAALRETGIDDITVFNAADTLEVVTTVLQTALSKSDVVLLTGGISVGDYDFVLKAANNCGVQTLFHKIKQRPGKPLFFGKKEEKLVFGLPGNPSSVLTCFYEYVMPALGLSSNKTTQLPSLSATLTTSFSKPVGLTQFLKANFDGEKVTLLDAQESYRMHSFARANCFIVAEEHAAGYKAGDIVEIHLLPC